MRLAFANVEFPSQVISNDEILEYVRRYSQNRFTGDVDLLVRNVELLLDLSGAKSRRRLTDGAEAEHLVDHALTKLVNQIRERDLVGKRGAVISASVDRVFSEPGDSYFYASQMGLKTVECFDLLDACNSHVRAWLLAETLLQSQRYEWVAVISCEMRSGFEFIHGNYGRRFEFQTKQELSWKFPALTLGDAIATSLLVKGDRTPNTGWHFHVESNTLSAPLCYVSNVGFRHFRSQIQQSNYSEEKNTALILPKDESELQFFCNYSELERASIVSVVNVWNRLREQLKLKKPNEDEWLVTHCSNGSGWAGAARWAGFSEQNHINLYSEFGNIVSCSVPASIAVGHARGFWQNNSKINVWTGAAGSSFFALQVPFSCWEN